MTRTFGLLPPDRPVDLTVLASPEQLAAIGHVDLAFMQLNNSYSNMDLVNKKGFKLMDQVKPRLIIHAAHSRAVAR